MAKKKKGNLFRMVSSAGTGYFYIVKSNQARTEKWKLSKYDPKCRKHVEFVEAKMK
jgi:large subunit ribosomal protein L33